ncbi:hypothetical protein Tco_1562189 [Tanacetum coccineum]
MRQYISITDHILWDIITNGNQATTNPASSSVSAPKTSLAANARRNNEKALDILLSAIPDRHLLSFHDAEDARTLWSAIKARFGEKKHKEDAKESLKQDNSETFTIGSREEQIPGIQTVQNILLLTMIGDNLYWINESLMYPPPQQLEGSTLKQSTADPANIPKGYIQTPSSKVQTAPNCGFHSDEIHMLFLLNSIYATTHDDEDLLQIDEDAMEEIDIRWQVAMITARIRKFMRKTGRPIDLKPKNGITFTRSNIECFNSPKVGVILLWRFGVESSSSENSDNSSGNTNSNESLYPIFQKTKGFHAVSPPTGTIIPPRANVSFTGIDDLAIIGIKSFNQDETKTSQPIIDRNKVIIEFGYDSDDEETALNFSEIQKKTVLNSENSETSFENKSPDSQNSVGQESRKKGLGHKGGKRDTRPVWNNIKRVNHSNFSGNSRPKRPQNQYISQSTDRPYYPRIDNIRPRTSSFSPSSRSSTTRTPYRPQRPKKIMKSIWVKKASTVGSQAYCPKLNCCSGSMTGDKDKLSDFKEFKGGYVAFEKIPKGGTNHRKNEPSRHHA